LFDQEGIDAQPNTNNKQLAIQLE